jgi:phoH family protein|nr:MAG TPA: Terminase large subunit [Caudoviricetes sp.]
MAKKETLKKKGTTNTNKDKEVVKNAPNPPIVNFDKKTPIHRVIDNYKGLFKRYRDYFVANNWVYDDNPVKAYDIEQGFVNMSLEIAKRFTKQFKAFLKYQYVKEFLDLMLEPTNLYMDRCMSYAQNNLFMVIEDDAKRMKEVEFQTKITSDHSKISEKYYALEIDEDDTNNIEVPIRADEKIPFLMSTTMEEVFPHLKNVRSTLNEVDALDITNHTVYDVMNSTEMFRNIKNPPPYDLNKHYYEQNKDTLDFYEEELYKIKNGVTIAGVFIHPLLYWHINFFKTDMPMNMFKNAPFYDPAESIYIGNPLLRDNELFFVDSYQRAQEQNLSLFIFGTRRFGKALWVGEKVYKAEGGTKNIGDIKVGDRIIGGDGKPTNVIGVYPQGKKGLFRFTLKDGRSVLCCREHLWTVGKRPVGNLSVLFVETLSTGDILKEFDKYIYELPVTPDGFGDGRKNNVIESIVYEKIDEAVCIRVDNKDSLFLTTDGIVTHNTVIESSLLTWRSMVVRNGEGYVVGGSDRDLKKLTKTMAIAFTNVHPAFRLTNNKQDWDTHIQLGLKLKNGKAIPYNDLFISNVNSGAKQDAVKTAGGSPSVFAVDEIGKFSCKLMYQQALPSFDTPEGRRCPVVLTGTGGEEELSRDAQDMLLNPEAYAILPMDWEVLENYVPESRLITWKRRKFGIFIPGQMSFKTGLRKKVVSFEEFMKANSESLRKIDLHITDWENAKAVMEGDRAKKKNDPSALAQEKMGYPFDPMECFVNRIENPFCAKEGQEHLENLRESGQVGKKVEITRYEGTKRLQLYFSDKELAVFPFKGGNADAPVVIFEDPPENPKFDFTYCAGLDAYKHDKASTDSVGVLYIYKRAVGIKDPFANKIVAVYAARPDRIETFNQTCEMLLEGYGAQCLMENADIAFQIYLRSRGKDTILLANGQELVRGKINPKAIQNNEIGLNTSAVNQRYIFGLVQNYTNEWITIGHNEEGEELTRRGIVRIPDPGLLQELTEYYPGMNADRLVAFGHALALADYWDSMGWYPKKKVMEDDEMVKRYKAEQLQFNSVYSSSPLNTYGYGISPYSTNFLQ